MALVKVLCRSTDAGGCFGGYIPCGIGDNCAVLMPPPKVTRTVLLLAVLVCPAMAAAQAVTGTILGTVRDATGAIVPGAIVTLHETATGLSRTAATNDHGDYTSPLLATGVYTLRLQAAGFKPTMITGVELDVDEKVRVDATLEIGDVADVVTVQADNPLVQRASSDLSATLVGDQIQRLPLNSRNFVQLTRTLPGVVRGVPGENIDGAGSLGWRQSSSFSANGQRNRDNNFLLDGLDNNEVWINSVAIFPNIDALDEMKVHTGIYAAEFGRSLGGVVSLLTKSGANAFRGDAFEFLRNDRFDANDWFNNRADVHGPTSASISSAPPWAGRFGKIARSSSATTRAFASSRT